MREVEREKLQRLFLFIELRNSKQKVYTDTISKSANFYLAFATSSLTKKNRVFKSTSHIVNRAAHFSCHRTVSWCGWAVDKINIKKNNLSLNREFRRLKLVVIWTSRYAICYL